MNSVVHEVEHNRNMNIRFNEWMVSGEKAELYPQEIYMFLRMDVGSYFSGFNIGAVMFMHENGLSFSQIKKAVIGFPPSIYRNLVSGKSQLKAYHLYQWLRKNYPVQIESLYKGYVEI